VPRSIPGRTALRIAGETGVVQAGLHHASASGGPIKCWVWSPNRLRAERLRHPRKSTATGGRRERKPARQASCRGQHLANAIAKICLRGRAGRGELSSGHSSRPAGSCSRQGSGELNGIPMPSQLYSPSFMKLDVNDDASSHILPFHRDLLRRALLARSSGLFLRVASCVGINAGLDRSARSFPIN
jgi:hypothetical protein